MGKIRVFEKKNTFIFYNNNFFFIKTQKMKIAVQGPQK